jgi:rod shape-determining protein MreB
VLNHQNDMEAPVLRELAGGMGAREELIHIGIKINVRAQSYDDIQAKNKAT